MSELARILCCVLVLTSLTTASAVSPTDVLVGRQLFEHNWQTGPAQQGDGLGPLFNATSCVACHHLGGVGGAGDTRFNAQSLAIERMRIRIARPIPITGRESLPTISPVERLFEADRVAKLEARKRFVIATIHPGFVSGNHVVNSTSFPHHGRHPSYVAFQQKILGELSSIRSPHGGPVDSEAVQDVLRMTIPLQAAQGDIAVQILAKLFYRNTPALFGAGLIDQISADDIIRQSKLQTRHPEISGRASVLRDGSIGRFGWRGTGNHLVDFVDMACANELGLSTRRRDQVIDPSQPAYRNQGRDISDQEIENIGYFIARLPPPQRKPTTDSKTRMFVQRGEQAFKSVGCAVCHVPTLGRVQNLYSDLLLHDMGPYLYDYDAAQPYVVRQDLNLDAQEIAAQSRSTFAVSSASGGGGGYGGSATSVSATSTETMPGATGQTIPTEFVSPRGVSATRDFVLLDEGNSSKLGSGGEVRINKKLGIQRKLVPSLTSQEWRTPPLWGVADSAPYLHDGRAATLLEAIVAHDGEAANTRDRFLALPLSDRHALIAFMDSLVAPSNVPKANIALAH